MAGERDQGGKKKNSEHCGKARKTVIAAFHERDDAPLEVRLRRSTRRGKREKRRSRRKKRQYSGHDVTAYVVRK